MDVRERAETLAVVNTFSGDEMTIQVRGTIGLMMLMWAPAAACGGGTPTSPGPTCEPVVSAVGRTLAANWFNAPAVAVTSGRS
jgi:hypothetical protein